MFKLTSTSSIIRLADNAFIPADTANTDFAAYQAWLAEGNSPLPADAITAPVPSSVTMRQARLALLSAGLLAQVNEAVAAMPGAEGEAARITWEFSGEVRRNDPLVVQLASSLNLSDEQLDQLFTTAAAL